MLPPAIPFIVAPIYQDFVEHELLCELDVSPADYWATLGALLERFTPDIEKVLATREHFQKQIDDWHQAHPQHDSASYVDFLREIGYLVPEGEDFTISSENVDPEIASIAGPQLVVPVSNARYALNAANARYGSLYDALYGTDMLGSAPPRGGLDTGRVKQVIVWAQDWLDRTFPLVDAGHGEVQGFIVENHTLYAITAQGRVGLRAPDQWAGHVGSAETPETILLKNHGLHVLLRLDSDHPVGRLHPSGIADIELEAALSVILDLEDSMVAVDAEDKVLAYRNLLGLLRGDLQERFTKGGRDVVRRLNADEFFTAGSGASCALRRRAMLMIRNVGHLMRNSTVRDIGGNDTPEGLLDAINTVVMGMHDLKIGRNSPLGSLYVVKPKMHGPEEVALSDEIFSFLEERLGLPHYTVKLGLMDEERRTSANLKECIRAAQHRVAFINTGFLDRTGDEIHTSMRAGAFPPKSMIKQCGWIEAYEMRNVEIGIRCGLLGKAQIGKGMWAMPDLMAAMFRQKTQHPLAGANCAWVPSPTAATLHALHYHQVDVAAVQHEIASRSMLDRLDDLLSIPLLDGENLSAAEISREIESNAQEILGYVVRWVDQGVGCSKVLDMDNVALMEDRATCRISSQLLANWLFHGVVEADEMVAIMQRMAEVVDRQNADDPLYRPMAPDYDGYAFRAALALVFQGVTSPSGYTEPILHAQRLCAKAWG